VLFVAMSGVSRHCQQGREADD